MLMEGATLAPRIAGGLVPYIRKYGELRVDG